MMAIALPGTFGRWRSRRVKPDAGVEIASASFRWSRSRMFIRLERPVLEHFVLPARMLYHPILPAIRDFPGPGLLALRPRPGGRALAQ